MQAGSDDMMAVRQQIMYLLHQQMEALDSPQGLTDEILTECYERQARVQELRERLQALANLEIDTTSTAQVRPPFLDNAASV
jgi:hypothetical protein